MKTTSTILAAAAALAILGGSAFAVTRIVGAQEPGGTPAAGQAKDKRFMERVATNLGIDVARLEQAIKDARLQGIDDALANGRINDGQAAKARERVNSGKGPGLREGHRQHERRAKIRVGIVESAASALHMSADELRAELKAGKSIADVASDKGVSLDDVKAAIVAAAQDKLNTAVAHGRIDQAKADELLQKLKDNLDAMLNKHRPTAPATRTQ